MKYHYFSKYFAAVHRLSKNRINSEISSLDVRATQSDLLMFIFENEDLQQSQIAREMGIDSSLLARDLSQLVTQGLVIRKNDPTDRRRKLISLSDYGHSVAEQLSIKMDSFWENILSDVYDINVEIFENNLHEIYQILQNLPDKNAIS